MYQILIGHSKATSNYYVETARKRALISPLGLLLRPHLANFMPNAFVGSECIIDVCVSAAKLQWRLENV